jgi:bifunctional non-homologous end joining protein LigD
MECQRVTKLPQGDDWLYNIKQDGYCVIAVVDGGTVLLHLIKGLDYTREFPQIVFSLKSLKRRAIFDAEIVTMDEQVRADFQKLQNRRSTKLPSVYYVFHVLHENGKDLFDVPLSERCDRLEVIGEHFSDSVRMNPQYRACRLD